MSRVRGLGGWLRRRAHGPNRALAPSEAYRRWALVYGEEPNAFQQLEAPVFERMLGEVSGLRLLDVGCGRGRIARWALEHGVRRAIAADRVLAMHAGCGPDTQPLRLVAPTHPLPFRAASFDLVTCALVLGHVADLDAAIAAMARLLRPQGALVISDFHPFATLRGWQRTFIDRDGRSRAIEQRLHTFSDYVAAFRRNQLQLEALEEPSYQGFPVAFVLRARKTAVPAAGERGAVPPAERAYS